MSKNTRKTMTAWMILVNGKPVAHTAQVPIFWLRFVAKRFVAKRKAAGHFLDHEIVKVQIAYATKTRRE